MPLSPQEGNGCLTPSKCLIRSSCVLFMNKNHHLTRDRHSLIGEICLITREYGMTMSVRMLTIISLLVHCLS